MHHLLQHLSHSLVTLCASRLNTQLTLSLSQAAPEKKEIWRSIKVESTERRKCCCSLSNIAFCGYFAIFQAKHIRFFFIFHFHSIFFAAVAKSILSFFHSIVLSFSLILCLFLSTVQVSLPAQRALRNIYLCSLSRNRFSMS